MSEQEQVENSEFQQPESGGGWCRNCCLGLLALLIVGLITLVVLNANAGGRLDARFVKVGEEVAALQAKAQERRATVVGAPANDDNAAVYYQGLEWVLTVGDEDQRRGSWRETRPQLPADIDAMVEKTKDFQGRPFELVQAGKLVQEILLEVEVEDSPEAQAKREAARAAFKRLRPALRYVRDGLECGTCDWKAQWDRGMNAEIPNLLAMRAAANLLAYEATLQPPREALQTGLEIVAFGQDIGRHGTMIGGMIGIAVSAVGFESLAHTMGREGLEASDYQRVLSALDGYRTEEVGTLLDAERVGGVVMALELSGRPLSEEATSEDGASPAEGVAFGVDLFSARELEGYEHFLGREAEISRMPVEQRAGAREAMFQELENSYYVVARIAIPNLGAIEESLLGSQAQARIARVLAAAHLTRLETGSFPSQIKDLEKLVGAQGLADPCVLAGGTAPFGYRVEGDRLLCWSVGENGQDDGGPTPGQGRSSDKDDRGLETRAPGK